jgi:hypothetical protein
VESRGKAVRQQALVPIPVGRTLAAINDRREKLSETRQCAPLVVPSDGAGVNSSKNRRVMP